MNTTKLMNFNNMKVIITPCTMLLLLAAGNVDAGTYFDSAHGDSSSGVDRSAITGSSYPDAIPYAKGHCAHCHEQHASVGGTEPLPGGDAENSYAVFKENYGVDKNRLCYACHETFNFGDGLGYGREGIYQGETKYDDSIHYLNSNMQWSPDPEPPGPPYNDAGNCNNCHNPHALGSTGNVHTAPGNSVSDAIKNVWGVQPAWPAKWTQPTSFTVRKPPIYSDGSQYEYQICFKCHSYYGLGTLASSVSSITGPSGDPITDQAWEFNINNKSAHPVAVSLNNQTGAGTPKPLTSAQMRSPWTSSVGNQTMYCSDCHGADNETTGAKGPHGSTARFMLKGAGKYWPLNPVGNKWTVTQINSGHDDYRSNWQNELFCANCHSLDYDTSPNHEPHRRHDEDNTVYCVSCHVAVPHGYRRSRLIGYSGDPAPYNYQNNLKTEGFRKESSRDDYDSGNCYSTISPCHTDHNSFEGPYEP